MIYVALLRGINVGGNNKIDMKDLKKTFENAGMKNVVTYINSGNVIFSSTTPTKRLAVSLEKAIEKDFKLKIRVLLRNLQQIKKTTQAIPKNWKSDPTMKSEVLFLWEEIDDKSILKEIPKKDVDTVKYVDGALLWSVDKKVLTKSGMAKLAGTKPYKFMTVRNVNTVRKLHELMNG